MLIQTLQERFEEDFKDTLCDVIYPSEAGENEIIKVAAKAMFKKGLCSAMGMKWNAKEIADFILSE